MRLVIKHVQHRWDRRLFIMLAFAVRIRQFTRQEACGRILKKFFHRRVLLFAGDTQSLELVAENGMERRGTLASTRETRHPYAIGEQVVIQQGMNAPK